MPTSVTTVLHYVSKGFYWASVAYEFLFEASGSDGGTTDSGIPTHTYGIPHYAQHGFIVDLGTRTFRRFPEFFIMAMIVLILLLVSLVVSLLRMIPRTRKGLLWCFIWVIVFTLLMLSFTHGWLGSYL
jgi:hypothetical protein